MSLKPKNKKIFWQGFVIFVMCGILWAGCSYATDKAVIQTTKDIVLGVMNWVLAFVLWLLAVLLTKLFALVLIVSAYNDFFNLPSVEKGWILMRDLCNMFFVVILLIIAFANIFQREAYAVKKTLPKLIFAAVAINFSKLICGLIIDFGQVVMLTFVNGYKAVSAFNLVSGLQLQKYITPVNASAITTESEIFLSNALAALLLIATIGAMFLLLSLLLVRIVYLWFLIVLSPIGFAADVLPATKKYATKWWDYFARYVAVGPILAFFLWLSLYTMANLATGTTEIITGNTKAALDKYEAEISAKGGGGMSEVLSGGNLASVAIAISMLYVGFFLASETSGYAGKLVGSVKSKMTGALMVASGANLAKKLTDMRAAKKALAGGAKAVARPVWGVMKKPLTAGAKGISAPFRAPIATAKAVWKAGKDKSAEVKVAGGGAGKAAAAGVVSALVGGFGGVMLKSAVNGWRTGGLKEKAEKYKEGRKKVDERAAIYKEGNLNKDALRDVSNNMAASFAERVAAVMTLAKNKDLTKDDQSTVQELKRTAESSVLYKNPAVAEALKDEVVKGGAAHIYYDLKDEDQKKDLAKAFKKGKIKYGDQGKEAHEDQDFDAVALDSLGVDRYVKAKQAFAEQSPDNEQAAQKSLEAARDNRAGQPDKTVDVDKICAAIFRMSGDLQQTFTYQGTLQMDKMNNFVRSMNGKDIDEIVPKKLDFTPDQLTKKESPAISLVQNVRFDALTKAANMEIKEKVVNAVFNEQIRQTIASDPVAGKIEAGKLDELQERIFTSKLLNQLVPNEARDKVQARVDAKKNKKGGEGGEGRKGGGGGPV